jgi:AraC-like DNA-binding protein
MRKRLLKIHDWEKLARQAAFHPGTMAALCPISLRQLERFFVEHFNETPAQWARKLKCRLACELIGQGWSNKAVVVELAFGNESHLCHEFKKLFGLTPQSFAPLYDNRRFSLAVTAKDRPQTEPAVEENVSVEQSGRLADGARVLERRPGARDVYARPKGLALEPKTEGGARNGHVSKKFRLRGRAG